MKKLFSILLLSLIAISVSAQTYPGLPLFGTSPNSDRTYRSLQLGITTISDSLGATPDTVTLYPGEVAGNTVFEKYYTLNLKDSCVLAIRSVNKSFTGSKMHIWISAPALSGWVQFLGYSGLATQWKMPSGTTKISPTASRWYMISFVCTGTAWVAVSAVQD